MRNPQDPEGQYDKDNAGFGVYCANEKPWTIQDYVNYVLNHKIKREKTIRELVEDVITSRYVAGKVNHDRPFTKDTYQDNLQQAIEEAADQLFYLVALHEKMKQILARLYEAERLINAGVELMTCEQLGQWEGVRAWIEEV